MIEAKRDDTPGRRSVESVSTAFYYVGLRRRGGRDSVFDCPVLRRGSWLVSPDTIDSSMGQQIIPFEKNNYSYSVKRIFSLRRMTIVTLPFSFYFTFSF